MATLTRWIVGISVVLVATALWAMPAVGKLPAGKSFATTLVARSPMTGDVETRQTCLTFRRKKMCTEIGDCGQWRARDRSGTQVTLEGELVVLIDGIQVLLRWTALLERAGIASAIGGTLYAGGMDANGALSGVQLSREECLAFALQNE